MGMNAKRACRALKAAGVRRSSLCGLWWPIGRQKRLLDLVRERRAVLEAKNNIVEFLVKTQGALAELHLGRLEEVRVALMDAEKKRLILSVGASSSLLEKDLSGRHGSEVGRALEQALSELVAEGVILEAPAKEARASNDVYLVVHGRKGAHYDFSELNRLLREGEQLRSRSRREDSSGSSRSYRM